MSAAATATPPPDALTMKKSEWLDDWYIIERAEHDGREWMERNGPNSSTLRCSARFSDADVEGSAYEMLALAEAIEQRSRNSFKRCAVRIEGERAYFCSPRNSQEDGEVSLAAADVLAAEIRATLQPASTSEKQITKATP